MLDISPCAGRTRYTAKDDAKARKASKFIGRGSARSSTDAYRRAIGPELANCGHYSTSDVVWISAEGNRTGRIDPDTYEISLALTSRAAIITDNLADRSRPYNIGERQVETLLKRWNYTETAPGTWTPPG